MSSRDGEFLNIPGVEPTGDVRVVDEWYELVVWSAFEVAVAFAQVDIDHDLVLDGSHD